MNNRQDIWSNPQWSDERKSTSQPTQGQKEQQQSLWNATTLLVVMIIGAWWYCHSPRQQGTIPPEIEEERRRRRAKAAAARLGLSSSQELGTDGTSTTSGNLATTNRQSQVKTEYLDKSKTLSPRSIPSTPPEEAFRNFPHLSTSTVSNDGKTDNSDCISTKKYGKTNSLGIVQPQTLEKKERKTKKARPPPVQIICEALSEHFNASIVVEKQDLPTNDTNNIRNPEFASWYGVGWWKRKEIKSSSSMNDIRLPLYKFIPNFNEYHRARGGDDDGKDDDCHATMTSNDDDEKWNAAAVIDHLTTALGMLLPTHLTETISSISQANKLYRNIECLRRNGHPPYMRAQRQKAGEVSLLSSLDKHCLRPLQDWLAQLVVEWVSNTIIRQRIEVSSNHGRYNKNGGCNNTVDDEGGLFSDEYDPSILSSSPTNPDQNLRMQEWTANRQTYLELLYLFATIEPAVSPAPSSTPVLRSATQVSILVPSFVQQIAHCYQHKILKGNGSSSDTTNPTSLAECLLIDTWYLLRYESNFHSKSIGNQNHTFSMSQIYEQLTILSNWIPQITTLFSPSVLVDQLRSEVSWLQQPNSIPRQLEQDHLMWMPVWCLAAFPLTELESLSEPYSSSNRNTHYSRGGGDNQCKEGLSSAWSNHVVRTLHEIHSTISSTSAIENDAALPNDSLFVELFRPDMYPKVIDALLGSTTPLMAMARNLGHSLLKTVAKNDKQTVFLWMETILKRSQPLIYIAKSDLIQNPNARTPNTENSTADTASAKCFSRSFLLGLTTVWIELCCQALMDRLASKGKSAFEIDFLISSSTPSSSLSTASILFSDSPTTIADSEMLDKTPNQRQYTGSTYFFFFTSALLHVGLHPLLKMERELHSLYRHVFEMCQEEGSKRLQNPQRRLNISPQYLRDAVRPAISSMLAFKIFLEDPDFMTIVTNFSLLQLEWLWKTCSGDSNGTVEFPEVENDQQSYGSVIPDWMFKDPARWLSHVASVAPHILQPHHAAKAVELSTQLLRLGGGRETLQERTISSELPSVANPSAGLAKPLSSPVVVTCLLRIASSFVKAGVNRVRRREQYQRINRQKQWRTKQNEGIHQDEEDEDDKEWFNFSDSHYLSFDPNDLGVTVFTNALVRTELCPTLLRVFTKLDVVEGLDVDREIDFDKFSVKLEISGLLLRLWYHPDGQCRQSVVANLQKLMKNRKNSDGNNRKVYTDSYEKEVTVFCTFASSIAATISVFLDDALQKLSTVFTTMKQEQLQGQRLQLIAGVLVRTEAHNADFNRRLIDSLSAHLTDGLLAARRLFSLLFALSQEDLVAAIFGTGLLSEDATNASLRDLSNFFVHFLDILTDGSGGTHPDLEMMELKESTLAMSQRSVQHSEEEDSVILRVLEGRTFTRREVGLDISVICHLLLALVARWHAAATLLDFSHSTLPNNRKTSPLLMVLAEHEDIDVARYRNILDRLVKGVRDHNEVLTTTEGCDTAIMNFFYHDGYGLHNLPHSSANAHPRSDQDRNPAKSKRRRSAKQNQMTHKEIYEKLSTSEQIASFLDDLEVAIELRKGSSSHCTVQHSELEHVQNSIMTQTEEEKFLDEDQYERVLHEWVVSSAPFAVNNASENQSDKKCGQIRFRHHYDSTARTRNFSGSGKTLTKEARRCHRILPAPHVDSSLFVCFAEERMDLCRAIVTGPVDTPYSLGVFVFDVFFPPTYPQIPPLVNFMTTGGGQVRFNPNLYVDGKVCLSLLGIASSFESSQRWNPEMSSLGQVLLSIQSQIFGVKEPYYNEGSGIPEQMKHTAAGRKASARHNSMLRLATLRHAVLAQVKSPPVGFEEVTRRHFSLCRKRIIAQARRWMLEEKSQPLYSRFEKVYADLLTLFSVRSNDWIEKQFLSNCLPPRASDLEQLRILDPSFPQVLSSDCIEERNDDEKPPAMMMGAMLAESLSNMIEAGDVEIVETPEDYNGNDVFDVEIVETSGDSAEGEEEGYNPWASLDMNNGHAQGQPSDEDSIVDSTVGEEDIDGDIYF